MEPAIIYEDTDILVVNKPAGISVNTAETTTHENTVQKWAQKYIQLPVVEHGQGSEFLQRGGVVHRLDKETSGVLILAKNEEAFLYLKNQFMNRTTKKVYRALAHGTLAPETGEINVPVGRLPWNRMRFGVVAGGREALTEYKVLEVFVTDSKEKDVLSYVELYPKTGRTHQLRVHLKHINHPIFADPLYAGRKTSRSDRKQLSRVFLHAVKLTIKHPKTEEEMTFESPLAHELSQVLSQLKKV